MSGIITNIFHRLYRVVIRNVPNLEIFASSRELLYKLLKGGNSQNKQK